MEFSHIVFSFNWERASITSLADNVNNMNKYIEQ
jgi:hypothetical protein